MQPFTLVFICALAAGVALRGWLYWRHARHVTVHRDRVPNAFVGTITLDDHRKAADYTLARVRLAGIEAIAGALLLLAWTLGGGLDLTLGAWGGSGLTPLLAGSAAIMTVLLIQALLDLPIAWWRTFVLEARFGFNRMSPFDFIRDLLISGILLVLLGGPVIYAILWLMGSSGPHWWLYAWAFWMAVTLLVSWIYPSVIAPLFNRFTRLKDGALKTRVATLLQRCGFTARGIFVMDGSRRSAHGNAYFTGLGHNKRIVLFDTLVERLGVEELEAVLAHELGHFKRRHLLRRLLLGAGFTLAGFWLLGALAQQPWFYQGLGLGTPSNAGALLLFVMAMPVFTQFTAPLGAWLSRRQESQADDYALAHADGQALIRALVKLHRDNASTLTPDPWYSAVHDSHPPAPVRIAHISAKMAET